MHSVSGIYSLALLIGTTPFVAHADDILNVEFDVPIAKITPRPSAKPIQLPNLTFTVQARGQCPDTQSAETISISIADTRITMVPTDQEIIEKSIRVSAKQLAPVAVENFCLADTATTAADSLQIDDALTAHLSLRCSIDSNESISYESVALSVTLLCEEPESE